MVRKFIDESITETVVLKLRNWLVTFVTENLRSTATEQSQASYVKNVTKPQKYDNSGTAT